MTKNSNYIWQATTILRGTLTPTYQQQVAEMFGNSLMIIDLDNVSDSPPHPQE